jgi:DDE superfamily endonuclease
MLQWIERVWKPHILSTKNGRTVYLLLDEYKVHMTSRVHDALALCNTEVDILPGGYTSRLQPMDVGLNKPFKSYTRHLFDQWVEEQGDNAKPLRADAATWASASWNRITKRMIQKTWNHIGYTSFVVEEEPVQMHPLEPIEQAQV